MKIQNYRGVQQATIINIKEGEGTHEDPARITKYVVAFDEREGREITLGKIEGLTLEEQHWLNKI